MTDHVLAADENRAEMKALEHTDFKSDINVSAKDASFFQSDDFNLNSKLI